MRQTVRSIAAARDNIDNINAREISVFVLHDPLMTCAFWNISGHSTEPAYCRKLPPSAMRS